MFILTPVGQRTYLFFSFSCYSQYIFFKKRKLFLMFVPLLIHCMLPGTFHWDQEQLNSTLEPFLTKKIEHMLKSDCSVTFFKNNFIKKRFLCDSLSTVLLVSLKLISIQQNWAWLHSKQILNAGWRPGSNCFSERAMQSWCVYCEARIFWEVCHLKLAQSMSCVISLSSVRWTRKVSCIVADKDYNIISSNLQENKALKDMWQKMWENEKQMFICLECRMDATGRKALGNVILPCGSQLLWHIEINKKSSVKIFLMANYIFSDWISLRIILGLLVKVM